MIVVNRYSTNSAYVTSILCRPWERRGAFARHRQAQPRQQLQMWLLHLVRGAAGRGLHCLPDGRYVADQNCHAKWEVRGKMGEAAWSIKGLQEEKGTGVSGEGVLHIE